MANYKIETVRYIKVEMDSSNECEYSVYDENKKLIDGGFIEVTEEFMLKEVIKLLNFPSDIKINKINEEID